MLVKRSNFIKLFHSPGRRRREAVVLHVDHRLVVDHCLVVDHLVGVHVVHLVGVHVVPLVVVVAVLAVPVAGAPKGG